MSNLDKLYASFKSADPMTIGENENNLLLYALIHAPEENIYLTSEELDSLIFNSNLHQQNKYGFNALIAAITYQGDKVLDISAEGFNHLLFNSNLKQFMAPGGSSILMFVLNLASNKEATMFTPEHWDYFIDNSDLSYRSANKSNALVEALRAKEEGYDLTISQYEKLDHAVLWTPGHIGCLKRHNVYDLYLEMKPFILEVRAILEEQNLLKKELAYLDTSNTENLKFEGSLIKSKNNKCNKI